jgi:uncharacterized protein (DUF58 family)
MSSHVSRFTLHGNLMQHRTAVSLLLFILFIAGMAGVNGALLLLALPLLLSLLLGLWGQPAAPPLQITRTLTPPRAPANVPVQVTLTITNQGAALAELRVADLPPAALALEEGSPVWLMSLPAGATQSFCYTVSGPRGAHRFAAVEVTTRGWLGLGVKTAVYPLETNLFSTLAPSSKSLNFVSIQPRRTRIYSGMIAARVGGSGTDFFGVRPYEMGDSLRHLNWHASARHPGALFTNEYEQERVADVGIILDTRLVSNPTSGVHSLLEHSITAASFLTDAFINQGNRVALLLYGDAIDYIFPGYGKVQREKMMHALARARLGQSQVFAELRALPTRLFPAKSQIVFVSPLLPDDVPFLQRLRSYEYQVMLASPNPVVYEQHSLAAGPAVKFAARMAQLERAQVLRQVAQAGIYVLDWDVTQPFAEAAGARLRATRGQMTWSGSG